MFILKEGIEWDEQSNAFVMCPAEAVPSTPGEARALYWIYGQLRRADLPMTTRGFSQLLAELREKGSAHLYRHVEIRKSSGAIRHLYVPENRLMQVQRCLSNTILANPKIIPRDAYGAFKGGPCDVAQLHCPGNGAVLMFDIKDAFFQVGYARVVWSLVQAGFSFNAARIIADLCTHYPKTEERTLRGIGWQVVGAWRRNNKETFLPQGAPTSPKLFQIGFSYALERMLKIAARRNVCGEASLYSDNAFLSIGGYYDFPPKLKKAILCDVQQRGFPVHKIRVVNHTGLARILGLNVKGTSITNTKSFRRRFRGALHHLKYLLDHGMEHEHAWCVVKGFWAAAVRINRRVVLPVDLLKKYEECSRRVDPIPRFV